MDRFTPTRIPARYSRYRHNTLDLHVLEKNVRSSLALYFPPSSLLQLSILSFVGGQGWPAMPLVSCQHETMAAPTCARAGSQLGTDHAPLIFLCIELPQERSSNNHRTYGHYTSGRAGQRQSNHANALS